MKKILTLEQKIVMILRSYWFDPYAKEQYIKNVTKKLVELVDEERKLIKQELRKND